MCGIPKNAVLYDRSNLLRKGVSKLEGEPTYKFQKLADSLTVPLKEKYEDEG